MAQENKDIIYQVKGADGLYHSVPESELKEFGNRQEALRKAGKTGLPPRTPASKEELEKLSRLREEFRQKRSSGQQTKDR